MKAQGAVDRPESRRHGHELARHPVLARRGRHAVAGVAFAGVEGNQPARGAAVDGPAQRAPVGRRHAFGVVGAVEPPAAGQRAVVGRPVAHHARPVGDEGGRRRRLFGHVAQAFHEVGVGLRRAKRQVQDERDRAAAQGAPEFQRQVARRCIARGFRAHRRQRRVGRDELAVVLAEGEHQVAGLHLDQRVGQRLDVDLVDVVDLGLVGQVVDHHADARRHAARRRLRVGSGHAEGQGSEDDAPDECAAGCTARAQAGRKMHGVRFPVAGSARPRPAACTCRCRSIAATRADGAQGRRRSGGNRHGRPR